MSQSSCKFLGMILLLYFSQVDSYPVWVNAKKMFDLKSAEAELFLKNKKKKTDKATLST